MADVVEIEIVELDDQRSSAAPSPAQKAVAASTPVSASGPGPKADSSTPVTKSAVKRIPIVFDLPPDVDGGGAKTDKDASVGEDASPARRDQAPTTPKKVGEGQDGAVLAFGVAVEEEEEVMHPGKRKLMKKKGKKGVFVGKDGAGFSGSWAAEGNEGAPISLESENAAVPEGVEDEEGSFAAPPMKRGRKGQGAPTFPKPRPATTKTLAGVEEKLKFRKKQQLLQGQRAAGPNLQRQGQRPGGPNLQRQGQRAAGPNLQQHQGQRAVGPNLHQHQGQRAAGPNPQQMRPKPWKMGAGDGRWAAAETAVWEPNSGSRAGGRVGGGGFGSGPMPGFSRAASGSDFGYGGGSSAQMAGGGYMGMGPGMGGGDAVAMGIMNRGPVGGGGGGGKPIGINMRKLSEMGSGSDMLLYVQQCCMSYVDELERTHPSFRRIIGKIVRTCVPNCGPNGQDLLPCDGFNSIGTDCGQSFIHYDNCGRPRIHSCAICFFTLGGMVNLHQLDQCPVYLAYSR